MSIRAITWALSVKTGSPIRKLILIKLADNANDEGYCWPSIRHIATQTEVSERSIREHIRLLADAGLIEIQGRFSDGVQLPNGYVLPLLKTVGVVQEAQGGGAPHSGGGMRHVHPNKPSSINRHLNQESNSTELPSTSIEALPLKPSKDEFPLWWPTEAWEAFLEVRKRMKAPNTERAHSLLISRLVAFYEAGDDVTAIVDQSTENGWKSFFPLRVSHNGAKNGRKPTSHDKFFAAGLSLIRDFESENGPGDGADSNFDAPRLGGTVLPA